MIVGLVFVVSSLNVAHTPDTSRPRTTYSSSESKASFVSTNHPNSSLPAEETNDADSQEERPSEKILTWVYLLFDLFNEPDQFPRRTDHDDDGLKPASVTFGRYFNLPPPVLAS